MKSAKKINNQRTCLITGQKLDKKQLIRLTKINHCLVIDKNQDKKGRGYYLIKHETVLNNPNLQRIIDKKTKTTNNDQIIKQLKEILSK